MAQPAILIFSPSSRKVWTDIRKALNPSYFIITYLAARLADHYPTYTITKSFDPVGNVKQYNGQHIDCMLSLGASYNPGTLTAEFNRGFAPHERAFEIADITQRVFKRYNPLHVNLCVDVRRWFDALNIFGPPPDVFITEQEMQWQQAGYLVNSRLPRPLKRDIFFFSGGVKSRQDRFLYLTQSLTLPKLVHGGGWSDYLPSPTYETPGFMPWKDSVSQMLRAKYSLTLHEPIGNEAGWITAKLFENFGAQTVTFVDRHYDRHQQYVPADHVLRVDAPEDISSKIKTLGYDKLLHQQTQLINPAWADLEQFHVKPFLTRFAKLWD